MPETMNFELNTGFFSAFEKKRRFTNRDVFFSRKGQILFQKASFRLTKQRENRKREIIWSKDLLAFFDAEKIHFSLLSCVAKMGKSYKRKKIYKTNKKNFNCLKKKKPKNVKHDFCLIFYLFF